MTKKRTPEEEQKYQDMLKEMKTNPNYKKPAGALDHKAEQIKNIQLNFAQENYKKNKKIDPSQPD